MKDFTLKELKTLKVKQRYGFRNFSMNHRYDIVTLQELIDLVHMLNRDFPRTNNAERRVGIYVEIKVSDWYARMNGQDPAAIIYKTLKDNNLHTIDGCKDDIPTVIQSFDLHSLEDWRDRFSESDLPRVFCYGTYGSNIFETVWDVIIDKIFGVYTLNRTENVDWREVSSFINGISPEIQIASKPDSIIDPMVADWDKEKVVLTKYSVFNAMLHSLDMASHPFPIAEDRPDRMIARTGDDCTLLHIFGGCDGILGEFIDNTYRILNLGHGNRSLLDFEKHPEREFSLDWYDYNADALRECIANDRFVCLPTYSVFMKRI